MYLLPAGYRNTNCTPADTLRQIMSKGRTTKEKGSGKGQQNKCE
jgi:hypothetical protein